MAKTQPRLGVIASHPIQYQSPLWRALGKQGLEVEVLYLSKHGMGASLDPGFGRVVGWDTDLFSGFDHRFLSSPLSFRPGSVLTGLGGSVVPAIVRSNYDAILVSGYASAGCLAARLSAALVRVPIYVRAETVSSGTKIGAGSKAWRVHARTIALRPLLRSYSGAFPIGWDSEEFYRENGVDVSSLTRAPYGVDNQVFARPSSEAIRAGRDRIGLHPDDLAIMHLGKLINRKRPEQAVRIAAALRARGLRARAVIVGSGPTERQVRESLSSSDVFFGFANQSEMPMLYAAADVVVVASTYETWGLVVNEALAAGTPVLSSSHVPAAVEMAALSGAVRILPSMDPGAWAESCISVLDCGREAMADQAMAVVGRYDVTVAATAIAGRIKQDLS